MEIKKLPNIKYILNKEKVMSKNIQYLLKYKVEIFSPSLIKYE